MSTDNDPIEKMCAAIRENCHLTVCEISEEVGISKSSCHITLTKKLKMHCVSEKFVPHMLTDEQKENHATVSQ